MSMASHLCYVSSCLARLFTLPELLLYLGPGAANRIDELVTGQLSSISKVIGY